MNKSPLSNFSAALAAVLALFSVIVAFTAFSSDLFNMWDRTFPRPIPTTSQPPVTIIASPVVTTTLAPTTTVIALSPTVLTVTTMMTDAAVKLDLLDSRLARIERVILDDPAKALEITLLNNELDRQKVDQATYFASLEREIERVSNQNNTFFATIVMIALAVLGLVGSNFFGNKKQ